MVILGRRLWQSWEGTSHLHIEAGFPKVVVSWALKESYLEDKDRRTTYAIIWE